MTNQTELPLSLLHAMMIIQNAGDNDGWMDEGEYKRTQGALRKLGFNVMLSVNDDDCDHNVEDSATDENGWTFFEVSIHPFVEQVADEDGKPVDGEWCNPSGGAFSDEFGDELDAFPDAMFRKGWSVSSWVRDGDEEDDDADIDSVDDEEFADYQTAIARAEQLAVQYRVEIDHRY